MDFMLHLLTGSHSKINPMPKVMLFPFRVPHLDVLGLCGERHALPEYDQPKDNCVAITPTHFVLDRASNIVTYGTHSTEDRFDMLCIN